MKKVPISVRIEGETGFLEAPIVHVEIDRLHYYISSIIGYHAWVKCRDAMAGVLSKNGDPPRFESALSSYIDILHEWDYLALSTPLVLLSATAAWLWVNNSKRPHHE